MPRPYGSYWWRRQDSRYLWWILGRCQCTHPGQYRRTHYSPYSHGLPPRHSLAAGVAKRTGSQEAPLRTWGLAQTGWPVDALEGGRNEGSQKSEDTVTRVAVPGGKARGRVVDKQGRNLWYGQCATLLGAPCLCLASPLISCLPHGGLGLCLCGWFLLAPPQITCRTTHKCHPSFSGRFWLPFELEEDSYRPFQHLVGVHHDPRPTTGPDGTYQTWIGHCSVGQNDWQPDLHEARTLGRLQWATNCCPLTKPFLQAFWQWKSAVKSSGKPNKLLRGFAHLLHCLFEKDYHHPTPYAPQSSWWGASDASASDSGEAYVGGWISNHPNPEKHQVWWFHYQVKEDQHPWAFKDRKPKRRIAALEMLGTLFLTMYLCKKSSSLRGPVLLPLASDNQGNIYGLLNDYTRKMPTAQLLMEIMFQLTATSCSLMPSHVKRDFNQWADDLTHPSFEGFDSSLELRVPPLLSEFKIFPWILRHLDAQGDLPGPEPVEPAAPAPKLKKRRKS